MPTYVNTDTSARVWPDIRRPDGSTLSLKPGETADLDSEVTAAWLAPADTSSPPTKTAKKPPAETPAA